ncbi:MAG: hypothetical protein ACXWT1_00890 [Methylobacter sp.]
MTTRHAGLLIFLFILLTFAIYAGIILYLTWPISEVSVAKSGLFGDSFGVLNALFSGMAFAGLIITVLLQRDEMHLSRIAFERQQFEASFFNLLNLYSKNLNEIQITQQDDTESPYTGVDAIAFLIKRLRKALLPYSKNIQDENGRIIYEYEVYQQAKSVLVHQSRYISTLQYLLDLVCRYTHVAEERERYIAIVASQMTSAEFKYLFYRCLVLPQTHPLVQMVNQSQSLRTGFAISIMTRTDIALYQRLHNVVLAANSTYTNPPHPVTLIRRLKQQSK